MLSTKEIKIVPCLRKKKKGVGWGEGWEGSYSFPGQFTLLISKNFEMLFRFVSKKRSRCIL